MAGENYNKMKAAVLKIVEENFRPEFLNRIDELVVFHALAKEQISSIAVIQIERLKQRLASKDLSLILEDSALEYLAKVGYDPVYGARPLKRAIQQYLENPLANDILAGKFVPGSEITVSYNKNNMVFSARASV